jgi:hypothetical protein
MPGVAPVAAVRVERHRGIGGGDLVLGCGESGAFGGVFALAADRTFGGVVHREPFQDSHHRLLARCWQNLSCRLIERQRIRWPPEKARCHPEGRVVWVPKDLNLSIVQVFQLRSFGYPRRIASG